MLLKGPGVEEEEVVVLVGRVLLKEGNVPGKSAGRGAPDMRRRRTLKGERRRIKKSSPPGPGVIAALLSSSPERARKSNSALVYSLSTTACAQTNTPGENETDADIVCDVFGWGV